jgi:outer membrane lipoprotein-sorting protein
MFRRAVLTAALTLVAAIPAIAQDLSLEEILRRHNEASGGLERQRAIQSRRMTGRLVIQGAMEATIIVVQKRPAKSRMDFTIQGITGTQAYDGETGWWFMPFMGQTAPERAPEDMARSFRDEADFDGPLMDTAEKGYTVELMGREDVDGSPAYKLKVANKEGDVTYYFIDAEAFLPVRTEQTRMIQGMETNTVSTMGDFKEVEGLVIPHSLEIMSSQGTQSLIIEKVEFNVEIPDSVFVMPQSGGAGGR